MRPDKSRRDKYRDRDHSRNNHFPGISKTFGRIAACQSSVLLRRSIGIRIRAFRCFCPTIPAEVGRIIYYLSSIPTIHVITPISLPFSGGLVQNILPDTFSGSLIRREADHADLEMEQRRLFSLCQEIFVIRIIPHFNYICFSIMVKAHCGYFVSVHECTVMNTCLIDRFVSLTKLSIYIF